MARLRIWNFQGYQINSIWNFQGLIKNEASTIYRGYQKKIMCSFQGKGSWFLVLKFPKVVIQYTDSQLRKASRVNRATNCAGNLGESKKYTVLAQINGIINKDNTISRDLMSFITSTILNIQLFNYFLLAV